MLFDSVLQYVGFVSLLYTFSKQPFCVSTCTVDFKKDRCKCKLASFKKNANFLTKPKLRSGVDTGRLSGIQHAGGCGYPSPSSRYSGFPTDWHYCEVCMD